MSITNWRGPDFIGIGVVKAATTWIFLCLKEHPEICVSSKKELHFFNENYNYKKGIGYYYSFFKHCHNKKVIGEYTPAYILSQRVPKLIYKHFPNTKLIVCLRNPVERAYSEYLYNVEKKKPLSIYKSFIESLNKDKKFLKRGFYYNQLKNFYQTFPKEKILVLFYKNLKKQPEKTISQIYSFLNLEKTEYLPSVLNVKRNVTGTRIINFKVPHINIIIYKIKSLIEKISWLEKIIQLTSIKKYVAKIVDMNLETRKASKIEQSTPQPLSREVYKYVYEIYKKDIHNLEKLLESDLSFWKP